MSDWTADQMPEMAGRTVVVTGANSGLGFEAVREFARYGASVVMACRSTDRGERAREDVLDDQAGASVEVVELDLASLASIREFADALTDRHDGLHVLCNNAGVMAIPRGETEDGFERQFGINHLGHFALTGLLLDTLRTADGGSRVVTQSSGLHENGVIDFADLQRKGEYDKFDAYARSKLANLLFAYELDRRLKAADEDVVSVACHPGYAATNLQTRGPEMRGAALQKMAMQVANRVVAQSAAMGALPMLFAATTPDIDGGEYVGPGGLINIRGHPEPQRSSERSYDERTAKRLWTVSEDLTGVTYDLPEPVVPTEAQ